MKRQAPENQPLDATNRSKAGHYEILGETYAKFEFFENGWNPYSRFLDVDKVDLILRRNSNGKTIYREVQVKYGKLYDVGSAWENELFDVSSWRFFKEDEFKDYTKHSDFYIAYVLARDTGYRGDIFIFPAKDFVHIIKQAIPVTSREGLRKVYISHLKTDKDKWVLRKKNKFHEITDGPTLDVSIYRRNFSCLL
jgi:hypothetical protein